LIPHINYTGFLNEEKNQDMVITRIKQNIHNKLLKEEPSKTQAAQFSWAKLMAFLEIQEYVA
jgi:hypothetical protein